MNTKYKNFLKKAKQSPKYWTEIAISDFTDDVRRLMLELNISQTELASRINTSEAYVSKILNGRVNFTLSTMTKLVRALGDMVIRVHIAPSKALVKWEEKVATADNHLRISPSAIDGWALVLVGQAHMLPIPRPGIAISSPTKECVVSFELPYASNLFSKMQATGEAVHA